MDRSAHDSSDVKRMHEALRPLRLPGLFRKRHIEIGFLCHALERPWRVHGGEGGGAHKRRRFFQGGPQVGRNCDDVLFVNKLDQTAERIPKTLQQLRGRGVIAS